MSCSWWVTLFSKRALLWLWHQMFFYPPFQTVIANGIIVQSEFICCVCVSVCRRSRRDMLKMVFSRLKRWWNYNKAQVYAVSPPTGVLTVDSRTQAGTQVPVMMTHDLAWTWILMTHPWTLEVCALRTWTWILDEIFSISGLFVTTR